VFYSLIAAQHRPIIEPEAVSFNLGEEKLLTMETPA